MTSMTSDHAIPLPTEPRELTRTYFDAGQAFGTPHAPPSTAVNAHRSWDPAQMLAAARLGADGCTLHPDLVRALCQSYVKLACTAAELIGERVETVRLGQLHAEASRRLAGLQEQHRILSGENLELRRRVAMLEAALRAAPSDEPDATLRFGQVDDDTEVVDMPLSGMEVGCG